MSWDIGAYEFNEFMTWDLGAYEFTAWDIGAYEFVELKNSEAIDGFDS